MTNEQRAARITGWMVETFSHRPMPIEEFQRRVIGMFKEARAEERERARSLIQNAIKSIEFIHSEEVRRKATIILEALECAFLPE